MSLKLAHTVFIVLAVLFCIATGIWALEHTREYGMRFVFVGIGCVTVLCGLLIHGYRFLTLTKSTRWL